MRVKIYISDMGKYRDSSQYEFIAEFADSEIASSYIKYMRSKRRYQKKDIIVKEVEGVQDDPSEGKVTAVISVMGENLEIDGEDFV